MLGQPLYGSTGPPNYDPLWMPVTTWIFAAQYFMEIYDNSTAKAAAGPYYNCTEGEILWTEYALDDSWHWTLSMGVVGDPTRTSSFVSEQPFMGLLVNNGTTSWQEPAYQYAQVRRTSPPALPPSHSPLTRDKSSLAVGLAPPPFPQILQWLLGALRHRPLRRHALPVLVVRVRYAHDSWSGARAD